MNCCKTLLNLVTVFNDFLPYHFTMSIIGITMGCPVGIGPEIILKYFQDRRQQTDYSILVLGDIHVLQRCSEELSIGVDCIPWQPSEPIPADKLAVYSISHLSPESLFWGRPDAQTGAAMANYIKAAVSLLKDGTLSGMTTCPISKFALQKAGIAFPGHTEMLAQLTSSPTFAMMMAGTQLRVTLVTIHCPLADVAENLQRKRILQLLRITHKALSVDFAIKNPQIAVAGFNPHGGEQGMFGTEEELIIAPAIEDARLEDINARGPFPPDTIFYQAAKGEYDAVVCMYHDQGLIPFKLLHFSDGVNVTLGLPVVRTSVDHGTAYDIAGKGLADPSSLSAAVELAWTIAQNRRKIES